MVPNSSSSSLCTLLFVNNSSHSSSVALKNRHPHQNTHKQIMSSTTQEVLVDALPYIDQGYDDTGVREAALAMVDEECRRYRPTKNYLEHLPTLNMTAFETALMTNEFERISSRQPMEPLSMKRYELPPPPPGKISELGAWQESVENSMAQLEHQAVRSLNLELMLEYGCEAWKAHLEIFTSLQAKAQLRLAELKKDIQEVNWQRKSRQTQAGEKLKSLEAQWVGLVSKNYDIEQACAKLEETIGQYRVAMAEMGERQDTEEAADRNDDDDDSEERNEERPDVGDDDSSSRQDEQHHGAEIIQEEDAAQEEEGGQKIDDDGDEPVEQMEQRQHDNEQVEQDADQELEQPHNHNVEAEEDVEMRDESNSGSSPNSNGSREL